MSILINKDTRVITQGITGKTGQFHTRMCREYANGRACFVAGVNPKKAGEDFEGIPIHASVKDAKAATGATVSVIYVPPAGAAAAIWEAVEADLDFLDFAYYGTLSDVSVLGAQLEEIVSVDGYDVAAFDEARIGLILQANTILAVRLRYIDETELRDKDDDIIPTELETSVHTHARLKIYVSIDLRTSRFMESELLTRDVIVE